REWKSATRPSPSRWVKKSDPSRRTRSAWSPPASFTQAMRAASRSAFSFPGRSSLARDRPRAPDRGGGQGGPTGYDRAHPFGAAAVVSLPAARGAPGSGKPGRVVARRPARVYTAPPTPLRPARSARRAGRRGAASAQRVEPVIDAGQPDEVGRRPPQRDEEPVAALPAEQVVRRLVVEDGRFGPRGPQEDVAVEPLAEAGAGAVAAQVRHALLVAMA